VADRRSGAFAKSPRHREVMNSNRRSDLLQIAKA
jgi:hypothetical protein